MAEADKPFTVVLRETVLEQLKHVPADERTALRKFLAGLAVNPSQSPDYHEPDSSGRQLGVKIVRSYAVFFFVNTEARIVRVLDLQLADRG